MADLGVRPGLTAAVSRVAAVDAQTFWMSAKVPNDQFLLYAFAGDPGELTAALDDVRRRAEACPDLRLRIADDCPARYPRWVPGAVDDAQFVVHPAGADWPGCLDAVAGLAGDQLDPVRAAWRLHVFPEVSGVPAAGAAVVVVLQIAHALADGTRTAEIAGWLFGRNRPVPNVAAGRRGNPLARGVAAGRAHRQLIADIGAGRLPAPPPPRPALRTNTRPPGRARVRTLVRDRRALTASGATVTVAALAAIGSALAGYLGDRGADVSRLGAEVPMRNSGIGHARNHFHNVGVGLHPDVAGAGRAELIARELRDARIRAAHPAYAAERAALASAPAALLRWGTGRFDPTARPPAVTGNTVVSSVNRGPADLRFGAAPVLLTAGYPALSPMMGLTHGVHGVGETVAVSVHTVDGVINVDEYLARLDAELG